MNTNSTITWSANPARIEQVAKRTFNLWTVALALLLLGALWQPVRAQWGGGRWGGGGMGHNPRMNPERPGWGSQQGLGRGSRGLIPRLVDAMSDQGDYEDGGYGYEESGEYYVQPRMIVDEPTDDEPRDEELTEDPEDMPRPNKVVEQPVDVVANAAPCSRMRAAKPALVNGLKDEIAARTDKEVERMQAIMDQKKPPLAESVGKLGDGKPSGYTDDQKAEILARAKEGDFDYVAMVTAGDESPEAKSVREYAEARQVLSEVHDAVLDGSLTDSDRRNLHDALVKGGFTNPGNEQQLQDGFDQLDKNNQLAAIVNSAIPGATVGPVTTILLAGRLGTADMIFLGNGTVLVGTQGATSGVVIAQGTTAQAVGMTAGNGDPLSEFDGNPVPGGAYVINRGSSEVNFVVAGKRHSLGPKKMKQFTPEEGDRIEFYRDGDEDLISYKLEECTYDFKCANGKWELYKQNYSVTLDNADNAMEFHYVVNNEQRTLAAGSKQKHSSKYPLVFRFDDGQGETRQKRVISGKYRVAVTEDGSLDMFRASDVSAPLAAADLAAPEYAVEREGNWVKKPRRPTTTARRSEPKNDAPRLFD